MNEEIYREAEKIAQKPHIPTLKVINDEKERKYYMEEKDGMFITTNKSVIVEKVGEFCYIAEYVFCLVRDICKRNGLELKTAEIDTKILRRKFPEKNFDAYSFDAPGIGLNMDGLTRISGRLYKIKK